MTTMTDPLAVQCPTFTVSVTGTYPTGFQFQQATDELLIDVDMNTALQTYDLTYKVEVASESYSFEYTVQFEVK